MEEIATVEIILSVSVYMEDDMCGVRLSLPVAEVYESVPVIMILLIMLKLQLKMLWAEMTLKF